MKNNSLVIFLLLFSTFCLAQGEANIWYFGDHAGVDFNSGNPVALNDGQIVTDEGCATISDAAGQLLFYTNGVTVWGKDHQIIPNGTDLMGHNSASQSAVIVPKPGSSTIYYIFTVTDLADVNGVRYSEVDLSLNNGIGAVTSNKNILLLTPACEKITAIKNANGDDYWVVIHGFGNNSYLVYSVTASGINTNPVINNVGTVIQDTGQTIGYLKFSPDGTKLISCNYNSVVELLDFNTTTGIISNPKLVCTKFANYGAEFSPSGNIAYITTGDNNIFEVIQYDITAADIPATATVLYTANDINHQVGALQLATNGKIYTPISGNHFLSVINNPEVLGTGCNFVADAVPLGAGLCHIGLPQFIQSYFNVGINIQDNCLGDSSSFSLTSNQNITSALWNFGDGTTSTVINPSHTYTLAGTYTVTVSATNSTETINKSRTITIFALPVANPIAPIFLCGELDAINFDMSQFTPTLLAGQSAATYGVAYFLTTLDAANHTNQLPQHHFVSVGTDIIYAKVYNLLNPACYVVSPISITIYHTPSSNTPADYTICEEPPYDGTAQFDLSAKNNAILIGQDPLTHSVSYHHTQYDADNNLSPLPTLYTNTGPAEQVFARVSNVDHPICYSTASFGLHVLPKPVSTPTTDLVACNDAAGSTMLVDLTQKDTEILNGQSAATFQVHYFSSLPNAQAFTNEITAPIVVSGIQTIYYTFSVFGSYGCSPISSFIIKVSQKPTANQPPNDFICDDSSNDQKAYFDLQGKSAAVLGSQNPADFTVSYHFSQPDADSGTAQLPLNYENLSNPQIIYVRVQSNINPGCFATTSFTVGLYKMPIAVQPKPMFGCDDQSNDGFETFDLSDQDPAILGTQASADFNISYYTSQQDADAGLQPLPHNYPNTSNPQTIYARLSNALNPLCYDTVSFELSVKDKPLLEMEENYSICEGKSILLTAPSGFSSYEWSNGDKTLSTRITEAGNYSLTVTRDYTDIICSTTKNIIVANSNMATITKIETGDWTDSQNMIRVNVSGDGDYEYSLDDIVYQDSPEFYGLNNGEYLIYVRDKKGCGTVSEEVFLLMYPKFFTPNGDSFNDFWKIKFSGLESGMDIQIFDRYGKLITEYNGKNEGWDGTLNGNPLPSTDYWFVVKRENGKEYRGHFSLKR